LGIVQTFRTVESHSGAQETILVGALLLPHSKAPSERSHLGRPFKVFLSNDGAPNVVEPGKTSPSLHGPRYDFIVGVASYYLKFVSTAIQKWPP